TQWLLLRWRRPLSIAEVMRRLCCLGLFALSLCACDDAAPPPSEPPPTVFGGERPVTLHVPPQYDPAEPMPLVVLLHGYRVSGVVQERFLKFAPQADARGFLYLYPDGTKNSQSLGFWNASDACCDFEGSGVDDVAYLIGLVHEVQEAYNVDPKRIYFMGHSNGGFMAYRMAC